MTFRPVASVAALAMLVAAACAVSAQAQSDPANNPVMPTVSLNGQSITLNGTMEVAVTPDLQQHVTTGTTNTNPITGQVVVVPPLLSTNNLTVGGGNGRSHIAQTFELPGGGAEGAWGFLEREARELIANQHQVPDNGDVTDWARGEMRAWMLVRLSEIISKPDSARSEQERNAVRYLERKVWDRRIAVLDGAIDQHSRWEADPCAFKPPSPFTYSTGLTFCSRNSLQSHLIGNPPPPSAADFVGYGAKLASTRGLERIVRELAGQQNLTLDAARPVVDTEYQRATAELRAGLTLLRVLGRGLVDGNTDLSGGGASPFTDEAATALKQIYNETLVSEATDILMEFAVTGQKPNLGEMIASEVVVFAKAIWDRIDLDTLDDKLLGARNDVERTAPDLTAMLGDPDGFAEIVAVFMEETLHDHLYERKQSLLDPPARQVTDLIWERTGRADTAWTSGERLADLPLSDWRRPLAPPPISPVRSEILASPRGHWFLLTDPTGEKMHSNDYGNIQVNGPEKSLSLGYTNWVGEHWMAWWMGSTFIHIKDRTPLGQAEIVQSLEGRCPPYRLTLDDGLTGPDCVKGSSTAFLSQLAQGDTVLIAGQYRTVSRVIDDNYFQVSKPFDGEAQTQPIVEVAGPRDTCWTTGECFESDEIHYRSAAQELKARFYGNRAPSLDPRITGTLQSKLESVVDPIVGGTVRTPVISTGYRAGTDVRFDARALDPDGDAVSVAWTFAPSAGTPCGETQPRDCTVQGPTARFRWDQEGSYLVSAVATDPDGATATWSRTIKVYAPTSGTRPVAGDDAVAAQEDTATEIFVAGNDFDLDNDLDPATVVLTSAGTHGRWEKLGNGRVRFTPDPDFNGRAEAGYRICDATSLCDDALVIVNVGPVNDAPVAVDDAASTSRGQKRTITTWSNDRDPDGWLVQGSVVRACTAEPSGCAAEDADLHGTWSVAGGKVTYVPAAGYTGPASYRYRICDNNGACDDATIRVEVLANDPPIAVVDEVSTLEDGGPITFGVLGNDSDPDGHIVPSSLSMSRLVCEPYAGVNLLTCVRNVVGAAEGDWSSNGDGTLTYTPEPDYSNSRWGVPAVGRYMICDDDGACSEGQVKVTVTDVNDAPRFQAGRDQTVNEDSGPSSVPNWTFAAAGPLRGDFVKAGDESHQLLDFRVEAADPSLFAAPPTIDADGVLRFTPAHDAHGSTTVTVRVHDDGGTANGGVDTSAPQTFTITINAVNDPPVCVPQSFSATRDVALSARVSCTDVDDASLSYELVSGTPALAPNGAFTYTGRTTGQDYFVFRARDPHGATGAAEATIIVTAVADPNRPKCVLGSPGTDPQGRLYIEYTVRDIGSGLDSIVVTKAENATMTVPSFALGTTAPVKVRETKTVQGKSSVSELRITDRAGNVTVCDPVLVALAGSTRQRFVGLHQAVSKLSLKNGRPGLRRVLVRVNGHRYRLDRLRPGRTYRLNLAKAMRPGAVNRVVVVARGPRRANAVLVISD